MKHEKKILRTTGKNHPSITNVVPHDADSQTYLRMSVGESEPEELQFNGLGRFTEEL